MIEIIITILIIILAVFILVKSIRNSSKGKCTSECGGCKSQNICSTKNHDEE